MQRMDNKILIFIVKIVLVISITIVIWGMMALPTSVLLHSSTPGGAKSKYNIYDNALKFKTISLRLK